MSNNYFVKFLDHSPEFYALIRQRPTAFVLLALIADRARKSPLDIDDGVEIGEAYIGDVEEYKATPQSYRTDKKYLEKFKIATFKSTNRGTIAKIVNSSIFDISRVSSTNSSTNQQQTASNQLTTKQEVRGEKEEESQAKPMEKKDFFHAGNPTTHLAVSSTRNLTDKNLDKEAYWDKYALKEANELNIEPYSDKYNNGREDFIHKATVKSPNSIRAFLRNANE